VIGDMADALGG